jgi:putative ABC transport system permease protein
MAWLSRIVNVLRPEPLQADLHKELSFHLLERTEELEAAGMSREDALRSARRQLGKYSIQVERTRDMDVNQTIEATLRNLRHAVRALAKSPGFAAAVVATLALGIGANSAVFSAIYAVLLRPLPFPDADRLVTVAQSNPRVKQPFVAPVRLADWNRLNTTFQGITGYYIQHESELSGEIPERLMRAFVAPRFLEVWGMSPAIGRDFTPAEEGYGGPTAVLISDRLWRRRYAADPNVVGKSLRFSGSSVTIVGVMPASFLFLNRGVDLWSPAQDDAPFARRRELTWYSSVGRMKPGRTWPQCRGLSAGNFRSPIPKFRPQSTLSKRLRSAASGTRFGSCSVRFLCSCSLRAPTWRPLFFPGLQRAGRKPPSVFRWELHGPPWRRCSYLRS